MSLSMRVRSRSLLPLLSGSTSSIGSTSYEWESESVLHQALPGRKGVAPRSGHAWRHPRGATYHGDMGSPAAKIVIALALSIGVLVGFAMFSNPSEAPAAELSPTPSAGTSGLADSRSDQQQLQNKTALRPPASPGPQRSEVLESPEPDPTELFDRPSSDSSPVLVNLLHMSGAPLKFDSGGWTFSKYLDIEFAASRVEPELGLTFSDETFEETGHGRILGTIQSRDGATRQVWLPGEREELFVIALHFGQAVGFTKLAPGESDCQMRLDLEELQRHYARLRARFVNSEGSAVPVTGELKSLGDFGATTRNLSVDQNGEMSIGDINPGLYVLDARALGYADVWVELELSIGQTDDLGTIIMKPFTVVSGRLVGEGTPLAGRSVVLRKVDEERRRATVETDRDGAFRFPNLAAGQYVVAFEDDYAKRKRVYDWLVNKKGAVEPKHFVASLQMVNTLRGDVSDLTVKLVPALEIGVRAKFANSREPIDCRLFDIQGQFAASCQLTPEEPEQRLWLAPGLYDARWSQKEAVLGRSRLQNSQDIQWVEWPEKD